MDVTDVARQFSVLHTGLRRMRSLLHFRHPIQKLRAPWHEPSYRKALLQFVAAVRGDRQAMPDLVDGYRSLEVICAAEQSAQAGRSISLPDAEKPVSYSHLR